MKNKIGQSLSSNIDRMESSLDQKDKLFLWKPTDLVLVSINSTDGYIQFNIKRISSDESTFIKIDIKKGDILLETDASGADSTFKEKELVELLLLWTSLRPDDLLGSDSDVFRFVRDTLEGHYYHLLSESAQVSGSAYSQTEANISVNPQKVIDDSRGFSFSGFRVYLSSSVSDTDAMFILDKVDSRLLDVLSINDTHSMLKILIVDESNPLYSNVKGLNGRYLPEEGIVLINASIKDKKAAQITESLNHEFAHALLHFSNTPDVPDQHSKKRMQSSVNHDYKQFLRRAKSRSVFPGMSIYSTVSVNEFFAEAVAGYLTGEEDHSINNNPIKGDLSVGELRAKHPELYANLELFFDKESDFYGDLTIFQ